MPRKRKQIGPPTALFPTAAPLGVAMLQHSTDPRRVELHKEIINRCDAVSLQMIDNLVQLANGAVRMVAIEDINSAVAAGEFYEGKPKISVQQVWVIPPNFAAISRLLDMVTGPPAAAGHSKMMEARADFLRAQVDAGAPAVEVEKAQAEIERYRSETRIFGQSIVTNEDARDIVTAIGVGILGWIQSQGYLRIHQKSEDNDSFQGILIPEIREQIKKILQNALYKGSQEEDEREEE